MGGALKNGKGKRITTTTDIEGWNSGMAKYTINEKFIAQLQKEYIALNKFCNKKRTAKHSRSPRYKTFDAFKNFARIS